MNVYLVRFSVSLSVWSVVPTAVQKLLCRFIIESQLSLLKSTLSITPAATRLLSFQQMDEFCLLFSFSFVSCRCIISREILPFASMLKLIYASVNIIGLSFLLSFLLYIEQLFDFVEFEPFNVKQVEHVYPIA